MSVLHEILQTEHHCELVGLLHGKPFPELPIAPEKLYQLKNFIGDDQEVDDFMHLYLDGLRICKQELEKMDSVSDDFCVSYLEALKPGATAQSFPSEDKGPKIEVGPFKRKFDESSEQNYASHKSRRGNLPKAATNILKKWLFDHLFHPYPTEDEKNSLSLQCGLTLNQISNWFINARRRTLQPMLESVRQQQQAEGMEPTVPIPDLPKKSSKKKSSISEPEE